MTWWCLVTVTQPGGDELRSHRWPAKDLTWLALWAMALEYTDGQATWIEPA